MYTRKDLDEWKRLHSIAKIAEAKRPISKFTEGKKELLNMKLNKN